MNFTVIKLHNKLKNKYFFVASWGMKFANMAEKVHITRAIHFFCNSSNSHSGMKKKRHLDVDLRTCTFFSNKHGKLFNFQYKMLFFITRRK